MQYNPYGQEHGWQERVATYTRLKNYASHEVQLVWLRQQWKANHDIKDKLLVIAKQVKTYGWRKTWHSWLPQFPVSRQVIAQAVKGIIAQGLV